MLVLNARFAFLAAFCSLATMTFSPRWGVGAAAIRSRSLNHGHTSPNVTSDRPSAQYVLPLPPQSKTKRLHSIAHLRRPVHQRRRRLKARMFNGVAEMPPSSPSEDGMLGTVALMSPDYGSDRGVQIAKIYAVQAPEKAGTWILYASDKNQTQFRLVPTHSVDSTSDLTSVMLEMDTPGETRTCVTYNSSPSQDESDTQDSENMTMEPCAGRANPEAGPKSQIFMYNSNSSTLEPTWNSNTTASSSSVNQNSTSSSNTTVTGTSTGVQAAATLFANRADIRQNSTEQNSTVTLVFTPVKAMVADVGVEDNSTTTGMTMTMTKTVTVFRIESTSTGVSSSTLNTVPQVTASSSALDVQLVGAPMSSNATGTTTTIGSAAATPSSFSTATGSIDAAAIASRIAASASASASSASAAASSTTISSSTDSAPPSSTQTAQRRENERLFTSDSKMNIVSTEPYTWMFKLKADER